MSTLAALQEAMVDFLQRQGIQALSAWPREGRGRWKEPSAVVAVKRVEGSPAGFGGYLGEVYDPVDRGWQEAYGQQVGVGFTLALYSPEKAGEEGCRLLLDRVVEALEREKPAGLTVEKWSMEETGFQEENRMFCGRLQLQCRGMLLAKAEETGAFLGFEVKGGFLLDSNHEA